MKTSGTPGKTREINFFLINERFRFVDLPGYGFSRAAKTKQRSWEGLIETYLSEARIGMTEVDTQLANARASELKRDATVRKESARIKNRRINAAAEEETELAELNRLKKEQTARQADIVQHPDHDFLQFVRT